MRTTRTSSKKKKTSTGQISDAAVRAKTKKTWPQWFKLLDDAGCREMNHQEIVAVLTKSHASIGGWWIQMVTVAYEQARGLRDKHEKPGGYEIGVSKTLEAGVGRLFKAWLDEASRRKWLEDPGFELRKSTKNKSMRITWADGVTNLNVYFYDKGPEKSQVVVQHGKLKNAKAAEEKKVYWRSQLSALKAYLER